MDEPCVNPCVSCDLVKITFFVVDTHSLLLLIKLIKITTSIDDTDWKESKATLSLDITNSIVYIIPNIYVLYIYIYIYILK